MKRAKQWREGELMSGFDDFWQIYPRRVGKLTAEKAWGNAIRKHLATAEEIIAGAKRYAEARVGQDTQFTAHPATWLNAGRWMDEEVTNGRGNSVLDAFERIARDLDSQAGQNGVRRLSS